MSITLETANEHLNAWLAAELAVTTGQSYKIGSRELTRANLMQIRERINFWRKEADTLGKKQNGSKLPSRVRRYVPID
ncbi:DUF6148 family protein [Paenibacillus crassostreae]|uniref:Uncharacterized protein n=1 Tax=Paenibacillus crassostreae TaxID=1763538 RepID=A0A167C4Z3_9BACL|nr:DUF6148 family protein [Paenibacillus crassostreae]AOZ91638.1 hypothetical protein LPB68_05000 [Paenibacillus crassostreae]OAB72788.1 hypothetical protein PNBC_15250 [Paenibacillus crassostreae]